jgi:hypothetical protein
MIVVLLILIVAFTLFRSRNIEPITNITWESKSPEHLDIAWYDKEEGQIYTVYWSNQPGIKIYKPETYSHSIKVTSFLNNDHHLAQIKAPYEWVYFIVTKEGYKSKEYEASILPKSNFTCRNLDPQIIKRSRNGTHMVVNVTVLGDADSYILTQYLPDGTSVSKEFDVKGMKTVDLRIPFFSEAMGYLSFRKSDQIGPQEFFFYNDFLSSGPYKWETVTQVC